MTTYSHPRGDVGVKMTNIRVKLKFDSTPVSYAKKCWFTFDSERCKLVSDVCHLIASHFSLKKAHGIQLYLDDYLIPTNESVKIIRDNDNLQVKTVESTLEDSDSDSDESPAELQPKPKRTRIDPKCTMTQSKAKTTTRKNSGTEKLPAPPPAAVKKIVGITTKSASGALHTKFQNSSSSSSDSSGSTSESVSPANRKKDPPKKVTQWDVGKNGKGLTLERNLAANENRNEVVNTSNKSCNSTVRRRKNAKRRKKVRPEVVIGGPSDVLTTKSTVYYPSPSPANARPLGRGRVNTATIMERSKNSINNDLNVVPEPTGQETVDKSISMTTGGSQDESAKKELSSESDAIEPESIHAATTEDSVPDYSSCPDLHGPPRLGDKLAFKVLELSSTYSPEISEFMEGTVLGYDVSTTVMTVKYSESSLRKKVQKDTSSSMGKFAIAVEDGEKEDEVPLELNSVVDINLGDLIEPKLLV